MQPSQGRKTGCSMTRTPPLSGNNSSGDSPSGTEPPRPEQDDSPAVRRGRPSLALAGQLGDRILDASWDVLLEHGFENFTFDRLARKARIGKATIYSRFATKRDLLAALLQRRIRFRRDVIMARSADLPLREALELQAREAMAKLCSAEGLLLERLIDWIEQEQFAQDGTARDETGAMPDVRAMAFDETLAVVTRVFESAAARGDLPAVNPETVAQIWFEALIGRARRLGHCDAGPTGNGIAAPDHAVWARTYVRFFLGGLPALASPPTGKS